MKKISTWLVGVQTAHHYLQKYTTFLAVACKSIWTGKKWLEDQIWSWEDNMDTQFAFLGIYYLSSEVLMKIARVYTRWNNSTWCERIRKTSGSNFLNPAISTNLQSVSLLWLRKVDLCLHLVGLIKMSRLQRLRGLLDLIFWSHVNGQNCTLWVLQEVFFTEWFL